MAQKELISKSTLSASPVVFSKPVQSGYPKNTFSQFFNSYFKPKNILVTVILIIFLGSLSLNFLFYSQPQLLGLQKIRDVGNAQGQALAVELNTLFESSELAVRKIVDANVVRQENPEAAVFYAQAQNNDVLFVYTKLQMAILYRPQTKQVINVAKLDSTNQGLQK